MEFKLSTSKRNTKQLNGWKYNNEKLYNTLTSKEREAINILMIEQIRYRLSKDRVKFKKLFNLVKTKNNVVNLSNQLIEEEQLEKLKVELNKRRILFLSQTIK
jgi:hypothetical protein